MFELLDFDDAPTTTPENTRTYTLHDALAHWIEHVRIHCKPNSARQAAFHAAHLGGAGVTSVILLGEIGRAKEQPVAVPLHDFEAGARQGIISFYPRYWTVTSSRSLPGLFSRTLSLRFDPQGAELRREIDPLVDQRSEPPEVPELALHGGDLVAANKA